MAVVAGSHSQPCEPDKIHVVGLTTSGWFCVGCEQKFTIKSTKKLETVKDCPPPTCNSCQNNHGSALPVIRIIPDEDLQPSQS